MIYASYRNRKLSKELKNEIEILVGPAGMSYGSK